MRNVAVLLLSIILLLSCNSGNKKQAESNLNPVISDIVEVKKEIDPDSLILEDFKKVFYEECKNWPVNFVIDSAKQKVVDYLNLLDNAETVSHRSLIFTQKKDNYTSISVESYRLSSLKEAQSIVQYHCERYTQAHDFSRNGDEDILYYGKLPFFAFRIDSTIYVVNSTANVGHIIMGAVGTFEKKYKVDQNSDIIPCRIQFIDRDMANRIRPAINRWLSFYKLDITQFVSEGEGRINLDSLNSKSSPYYREFEEKDNVYTPQLHDYSPNRRYYLNLLDATMVSLEDDGRYHFRGADDSQHIILYDRNEKKAITISYRGLSNSLDAVFWVDNNTFVLAGYRSYELPNYFTLEIYELAKDNLSKYAIRDIRNRDEIKDSYLMDINMKKRGVVIDD